MDLRQVKDGYTLTLILFAWRDKQYSNGNMSMVPRAQNNWEVDLGYCTSMSGIKGHEQFTFLIYTKSMILQQQYLSTSTNKQ